MKNKKVPRKNSNSTEKLTQKILIRNDWFTSKKIWISKAQLHIHFIRSENYILTFLIKIKTIRSESKKDSPVLIDIK
jgi:hypothetical protein